MEFSSIVLMEVDKQKHFIKELGSYEIGQGAENIRKFFCQGEEITVYFDTNKEVEDWEFTAIYDFFNEEDFSNNGFTIEPYDEEYNPTWIVKFQYHEDHEVVKEKINRLCSLITLNMKIVFDKIKDKQSDYN